MAKKNNCGSKNKPGKQGSQGQRAQREAILLRENLKRRKMQARSREAGVERTVNVCVDND
jgi:hypothetical protein